MNDIQSDSSRNEEFSRLLRDFQKVIKVVSVYPPDNSLPQSLRQSFGGRLLDAIDEYGTLHFAVDKEALLFEGEIVHKDTSREDNLAGLFFGAGITEFSFREVLVMDDIQALLDAFKTYLNLPESQRDLPGLLWEAELNGFDFETAEDVALADYDAGIQVRELFTESDAKDEDEAPHRYEEIFAVRLDDEANGGDADSTEESENQPLPAAAFFEVSPERGDQLKAHEAASAMGLDDLPAGRRPVNSSLILSDELKLSEEEEVRIRNILEADADFDMYESTTALVVEMLFQEAGLDGFHETAVICEKLLTEYIRKGALAPAAELLHSLKQLEGRIRSRKPLWADRLKDVYVTAGTRDRLRVLTSTLNDHGEVTAEEFACYLGIFDWQALSGLTDLLGELEHRQHREALCEYLIEQGRGNIQIISKGIYDKRWYVVRNSVMILGHIGTDQALEHLGHVVEHKDRRVRWELVVALRHCPNAGSVPLLGRLVHDADAEVSGEALNALCKRNEPEAAAALEALIHDAVFERLERSEQRGVMLAYSRIGGEQAVRPLERIIRRYNIFRDERLAHLRGAAFDALVRNPSEKAERLLARLAADWRPDIRKRAAEAARRRDAKAGGR